jgi:hypothetical protein
MEDSLLSCWGFGFTGVLHILSAYFLRVLCIFVTASWVGRIARHGH